MLVEEFIRTEHDIIVEGPLSQRARAAVIAGALGIGAGASIGLNTTSHVAEPQAVSAMHGDTRVANHEPFNATMAEPRGDTPRPPLQFVSSLPSLHAEFPRELHDQASRSPAERRQVFIAHMTPIIAAENARIRALRAEVEQIARKPQPNAREQERLNALATQYRSEPNARDLMRHIDIVPPGLVLAQAALESGWGTSPVARRSNALFGQKAGAGDRYAAFDNLGHSVASYIRNLNSHRAYAEFRRERERMRRTGKPFDASALAATLGSYSELGRDYTASVAGLIRSNRLDQVAQTGRR